MYDDAFLSRLTAGAAAALPAAPDARAPAREPG
jgi:hypothetical protein